MVFNISKQISCFLVNLEKEKKIDEILGKLEKYNKENKSLDIRNEYADTRYRRKKAKPKIKRVSIRR